MGQLLNLILMLFVGIAVRVQAQSSYFKRSYFSPSVTPTALYYHHHHQSNPYPALTYTSDLVPEASKRKEYSKPYSKKVPFRPFNSEEEDLSNEHFASAEFSSEGGGFASKETDSREYSIGTQIRVQHPISIPKKATSPHPKHIKYTSISPYKSSSYSEVNLSSEYLDSKPPSKKHAQKYTQLYEPDPFHVVAPPKSTVPAASASNSYNVYEPDEEEYDVTPHTNRLKSSLRDRFKGVASKKQIEKYLEDQQKLLDEALKLQLINTPKFHQLLKSKDHDHFEEEDYERDLSPPSPPFRPNFSDAPTFKPTRSRRRPQGGELKRSPKGKPIINGRHNRKFRSAIVINV